MQRIADIPSARSALQPGGLAVVVGAGVSGLAAGELLEHLGARVRMAETRPLEDRAMLLERGWDVCTGAHQAGHFADADLVVLSPGVNRRHLDPFLTHLRSDQVVSELELALWQVNEPIIAVTGTSGKTTTTTLIGAFLTAMGRKVFVGGNIGTPLSRYVLRRDFQGGAPADILVLEVSSFQLLNTSSLRPSVGVLLNISPNHLDYHTDMEEYRQAKFSLFARQGPKDTAIFAENLRADVQRQQSIRAKQVYFQPTTRLNSATLSGQHNQANLEAAFLACRPFGLGEGTAKKALEHFSALPHRLQIVAEHQGVLCVDDSKGTTVTALHAALQAFDRPILLLAGGVFKGGDLAALKPLVQKNVRMVGLFGANREIFEQAWSGVAPPLLWEPTLEQAMDRLWREAKQGDVLLLSPATASFDLFSDYKARGLAFQRQIQRYQEQSHG